MAANTFKPTDAPRRANVPRPAPAAEPANVVPAPAAVEPAVPTPREVRQQRRAEKAARKQRARAATEAAAEREPAAPRRAWSLFSLLDRATSVEGLFREGLPVRFLPYILFVMLLTLLYIGNTHYGNRMARNIQKLKQETEDLRADYTTLKSDYMEASKQSEVARKVAALGMVESSSPPFRITVPPGQLDAAELELLPVLTADTLAARAARDSAATHLADSLAGRRRVRATSSGDIVPEIIAPPTEEQLADEAAAAAARPAAPKPAPVRPAKPPRPVKAAGKPNTKPARPAASSGRAKRTKLAESKPNKKPAVQKSTTKSKVSGPVNQPAKSAKR